MTPQIPSVLRSVRDQSVTTAKSYARDVTFINFIIILSLALENSSNLRQRNFLITRAIVTLNLKFRRAPPPDVIKLRVRLYITLHTYSGRSL